MEEKKPLVSLENHAAFHRPAPMTKQTAAELALRHFENGDYALAEPFAIQALALGSENAAPILLTKIAKETKSPRASYALAKYYWNSRNLNEALFWAVHGKQHNETDRKITNLLHELEAHQRALLLHQKVLKY